jgi:hypothetical protein
LEVIPASMFLGATGIFLFALLTQKQLVKRLIGYLICSSKRVRPAWIKLTSVVFKGTGLLTRARLPNFEWLS